MSWKKEISIIVRSLSNDLDIPYKYSDNRLYQTIVVAAQFVSLDVNLPNNYVVDISPPAIAPDPTELLPEKDVIFISLVSLKAACIIDQSTYRTKAALEGIRASLGSASLSVSGQAGVWKTILDYGPCKLYDELTQHWDVANATQVRAIFTPFVGNNFDPQNLSNPSYDHSRLEGNEFY